MWLLFAIFVVVFAASQLMLHEYDDLNSYQKFMYILVNIALYMTILLPILILIVMVIFGISFGVATAKIMANSSSGSVNVNDRYIYEDA